jgi:hypothetical protein
MNTPKSSRCLSAAEQFDAELTKRADIYLAKGLVSIFGGVLLLLTFFFLRQPDPVVLADYAAYVLPLAAAAVGGYGIYSKTDTGRSSAIQDSKSQENVYYFASTLLLLAGLTSYTFSKYPRIPGSSAFLVVVMGLSFALIFLLIAALGAYSVFKAPPGRYIGRVALYVALILGLAMSCCLAYRALT